MLEQVNRFSGKIAISLVLSSFFALLWDNARGGADFGWYVAWMNAALSGDIFAIPGDISSPVGVPLTQWSNGPGFIFSLGALPFVKGINPEKAALFVGWISTILLWWAIFNLIRLVVPGDKDWTIFGIAISFLGTHLGYYSDAYSSESLSFAILAVLIYWLVIHQKWQLFDSSLIGILGGFLIMVRPHLGLYVLIAMAIAVYRVQKNGRKRTFQKGIHLTLIGLPIVIVVAQVLIVNRWMTGSLFQSPYTFGDGDFKSFDFTHPHLSAILFHPWHGLFIYHPLYGIAFLALVLRALNKKLPGSERLLMSALIIVIIAHYYLQASWYCWWLGLGTFGMRGMGVTAVILVPILMKFISEIYPRRLIYFFLLTLITASCLWSFALLWQGETQFMTYHQLVTAQLAMLRRKDFIIPVISAIGFVLIGWGIRCYLKNGNQSFGSEVLSTVGLALVFFYCARDFQIILTNRFNPKMAIMIIIFLALVWVFLISLFRKDVQCPNLPKRRTELLIGSSLFLGFIIITILFGRLMVHTEAVIAQPHKINRVFSHSGTFYYPEVRATYEEYLRVPCFVEEKEKLRKFLEKNNPI